MAKIIYWKSNIDPNLKEEFQTERAFLGDVLKDLGIDKDPLSVIYNGEIPDDLSLDLELKKEDVIEIRRVLHGSSSQSKNNLATFIQIATLIAITVLSGGATSPWLIAGIGLVGGLASGALRYRAAKLALRNTGLSQSEVDTEANNFSLTSANNESRPLQPVALVMGSIRSAPDYHSRPYPGFWGGTFDVVARTVFGAKILNPDDPNLWPDTMPAGFLASSPYNWPPYNMKIEPTYDLADITAMTTAQRKSFAPQYFVGPFPPSMPVLLYHADPADPYYGRISPLAIFALQGTNAANLPTALNNFLLWHDFGLYQAIYGALPGWFNPTVGNEIVSNNYFRWRISNTLIINWGGTPTYNQIAGAISTYIFGELNKGFSIGFVPTTAGFIRFEETQLIRRYEDSPSQAVTHVFNYGFGDLDISEKRIEKTLTNDIPQAELSPINQSTWQIPGTMKSSYSPIVKVLDGANLNNNADFNGPSVIVQPTDLNNYNFINRVTPIGTEFVEIDFEGQLYSSTSTGLALNSVTFELQYKLLSSSTWQFIELIYFFNDNVQVQRFTYIVPSNFSTFPSSEIEFRIRKLEPDSENNNGTKVAQFAMTAFKCFLNEDNLDLTAQNMEGLFLVANTQTSGQTNKYSVQLDAKAWVYDFDLDVWNWELTRNPAWWFLYFARGGFKNPSADGTFTFPWSPTFGWVNGPGHPDSTEILWGAGMSDDKIDIEGIKVWAQFCDDKELYIDTILKDASPEAEILEKIANVGRGSVSYYKGLLSVVYEDNEQIPVGLYGMGNIIEGSFTADYSVANTPSKVIGTYIDRDRDWETSTVEAVVPFSEPDDLNFITTTLDGITTEEQAQREVNILAARQYFQKRTYSWKVDREGLIAKRGDLVYLSHDSTQFDYSGRVLKFILEDDSVIGIETTAEIPDTDVSFVTLRKPNGALITKQCSVVNCQILFVEELSLEDSPYYLSGNNDVINEDSAFFKSFPEDYIFAAGPLSTTGKVVRISEIEPDQELNFTITAIDEDPAMWSYEYGPPIDPESFDNSIVLSRVYNFGYRQLGEGLVEVYWEVDGSDFVKILNLDTGLLVTANGQSSFSGNKVVLELVKGAKYNLSIQPFAIGEPYKQLNGKIIVWA